MVPHKQSQLKINCYYIRYPFLHLLQILLFSLQLLLKYFVFRIQLKVFALYDTRGLLSDIK